MSALDIRAIARHYGGSVSGGQALIPAIGHSKADRGVAIKPEAGAPDGCLVHVFNGGDPLADKDRLRTDGFLPKFEPKPTTEIGPFKPVAIFEFANADGEVIYRTVRLQPANWTGPGKSPKEFRAERFEGGRWVAGIKGIDRVPYRLPELAQAIAAGETVYLTEGEAKADKLCNWGFAATAIAFGSNGWRDSYAQHFEGARVVILPDNDTPGRDFARKVYNDLEDVASPCVVELPGLPEAGDIIDWKGEASDLEALCENPAKRDWLADQTASRDDPEPVDLWAGHTAPELPQGLLPGPIETFARSHGETMGVDPAGLAMACLAVCAAAITDEIELQVKQHDATWRESARLWVALVGAPSMKKSPIISAAARPLRKADALLMETYTKQRNAYDLLSAKERKAADRPKQERRVISDSTVEAAQEVLKDSPRGVLNLQDELSGFFGAMDKYAPGKGAQADRGFWLQSYNGGTYSLNRIGRGASLIPNCSICLLGGIQPEPIRAIAGDTHDDGLLQRLLPVVLRPGRVGRDVASSGTAQGYESLIERLNALKAGDGPLRLDGAARAVRERLEREHLELVQSLESVSPKMAAHFGKHDGLFARLCVLWHCIERGQGGRVPDEISGPTAERVTQFMVQFIRRNAVAFYAGLLGMSHGHDRLVQLAAWIVSERLERVTPRDVQRSGQTFRHVSADDVRALCEKLEAFGWGSWGEPGPKSNRPPFLINPRVHSLFSDHGKAEAERREKARKLIAETIGG